VIDAAFAGLATPRLRIRRFAASDAEALSAYRSDPAVARLQAWDAPYPIEDAKRFVASLAEAAPGTPGTWFQFAVTRAECDALVGDVALHTLKSEPRQAELGFTFAAAHQGRGFAAEAVAAVLDYAFGRLAMHRVVALTDARNARAQRLLERLGFRREATLRDNAWFKGAWATELLYAQLASEWRRRHAAASGDRS
jgi:RimJ/RimL family protein N-acetyltransferase